VAKPTKIAECLIGDETGCVLFTARNEQGTVSPSVLCINLPLMLDTSIGKTSPTFHFALF
jgi:hypothetical protein